MPDARGRIRLGLFGLGALLLALLLGLRLAGVDRTLLAVLAAGAGLLVVLLLITYRAFAGVAEAARNAPPQPIPDDDEDEE